MRMQGPKRDGGRGELRIPLLGANGSERGNRIVLAVLGFAVEHPATCFPG